MPKPEGVSEDYTPQELAGFARMSDFNARGFAYAMEHGTRPSTIGHVLSSNPVALLAWWVHPLSPSTSSFPPLTPTPRIAEKFLTWTDADPPLDVILESVSLYWFTETSPRSIYPYRQVITLPDVPEENRQNFRRKVKVPLGFSWFPKELVPIPKAWIATSGDLVFFREHDKVCLLLPL